MHHVPIKETLSNYLHASTKIKEAITVRCMYRPAILTYLK